MRKPEQTYRHTDWIEPEQTTTYDDWIVDVWKDRATLTRRTSDGKIEHHIYKILGYSAPPLDLGIELPIIEWRWIQTQYATDFEINFELTIPFRYARDELGEITWIYPHESLLDILRRKSFPQL